MSIDPIEAAQRERVVEVAKTWLRTPYHHMGRVKGVGVDCLTLLAETYEEASLIDHVDLPFYPKDWHLHRDAERYMDGLLKYAKEIPGDPQPGDIVLFRYGRCFSHGAIVVAWPEIIHAFAGRNCMFENVEQAAWLQYVGENGPDYNKPRPRRYFSYWSR